MLSADIDDYLAIAVMAIHTFRVRVGTIADDEHGRITAFHDDI